MALRDKLRARVQPLLEPGEEIQAVFLGQTGPNPNLIVVTYLIFFFAKYYVVAVTNRNIVLCRAPMWMPSKPKGVTVRLPRETRVGPPQGGLWSQTGIAYDGKPVWVHRRFYKDIEAADAAQLGTESTGAETPAATPTV